MALETLTGTVYLNALDSANPVGSADPMSDVDAHIRGIKNVLKLTFPNLNGAISATDEDLAALVNAAVLLSTTTSELTIKTGKTLNLTDNSALKLASTAVTSTAAELNLLDAQQGAALLTGIAAAGGTADAITATFSPSITLTDKVTVLVRAASANATTTPTFQPNGTVAKTIVKHGNIALLAGDIRAAGHNLILQYNSTNDNWELLNPMYHTAHDHSAAGETQLPAGGLAADCVIQGKIKTAENTASGSLTAGTGIGIQMEQYSFAPMIYTESSLVYVTGRTTDPGTSQPQLGLYNADAAAKNYAVDWRYITSS